MIAKRPEFLCSPSFFFSLVCKPAKCKKTSKHKRVGISLGNKQVALKPFQQLKVPSRGTVVRHISKRSRFTAGHSPGFGLTPRSGCVTRLTCLQPHARDPRPDHLPRAGVPTRSQRVAGGEGGSRAACPLPLPLSECQSQGPGVSGERLSSVQSSREGVTLPKLVLGPKHFQLSRRGRAQPLATQRLGVLRVPGRPSTPL